ncbi:MAG: hypothetical protein ABW022_20785 [Actinoplanes sp.]
MTESFTAPDLRRLRYFNGQMLGARDLRREQDYFREKLKLRMRCLAGYGVAHGLSILGSDPRPHGAAEEPAPSDEDAQQHGHPRGRVRLTPGLGVDAHGNEIIVPADREIDLWHQLPPEERQSEHPPRTIWIGIEYAEEAVEPTRTVFTSACGDTSDCEYGWTRETYRVRVTGRRPEPDRRCDSCGEPGDHSAAGGANPVLWLARIDDLDWRGGIEPEEIHMCIRRLFGRRVPTVITGISWRHGHTYSVAEAQEMLGTFDPGGGLRVRFSDEIRTSSLRDGVLDIQVIEGGSGRNATSWWMGGKFEDCEDTEFTREIRYRQRTRETLQEYDRVLITIRTAFLLDRCCRPVDGTHVGGKVPLIGEHHHHGHEHGDCRVPPSGIGPWTSGSGAGGDVFESWFFVAGSES